jgi:prepilin-type N-terminal cleavage/methylation domain-containing protein
MNGLADERGMTLVEVMMSVAILGIIIVPITAAIMLGFATSNGTRERINDSTSAQLLSAYAPTDVQSAKWVIAMLPLPSPSPAVSCTTGGTPLLRLEWDDPALAERTIVTYERVNGAPEGPNLLRVRCNGSGTVLDSSTIVHAMSVFTVTCTRDGGTLGCPTQAECDSPTAVRKVTLDLTTQNLTANDVAYSPYSFRVEGTRRVTRVGA